MSEQVSMRVHGPKPANHPSIGRVCPLCDKKFDVGDFTCLLGNEPSDDEQRALRDAGRSYIARADEVHADCIPGSKRAG